MRASVAPSVPVRAAASPVLAAALAAVVAVVALGAVAVALGARATADEGPRAPSPDDAGADAAAAALVEALPRDLDRNLRVAIVPAADDGATGPASELRGRVLARASARLQAQGATVLDESWLEGLRRAEATSGREGPAFSAEQLAQWLGCRASLRCRVLPGKGGDEVEIALLDARTGATIARATARAGAAGPRTPPAPDGGAAGLRAPPAPDAGPGLAIDRAVIVERRLPAGGFAAPEVWDGRPLAMGDHIQIWVRPQEACTVSVVVFESDGTLREILSAAPVAGGAVVKLPPREGNYWYRLVEPAGTDVYFIVAERDPRAGRAAPPVAPPAAPPAAAPGTPAGTPPAPPPAKPGEEGASDAAVAGAPSREKVSRLWDEADTAERRRSKLEAGAQLFALEMQFRKAFGAIAGGAGPLDETGLRKLGEPEPGGSVQITWEGGTVPVGLFSVEGGGAVVERFAIAYR